MNVENIRALAKKMRRLKHEEHYHQDAWVKKTSCGTAACLAGHAAILAGYKPLLVKEDGCGDDSCCPSGMVVDGVRMRGADGKVSSVESIAKRFLGVTGKKARRLFSAYPADRVYDENMQVLEITAWPKEFAERWNAALDFNKERPSRIAADLLDAIADGKVKL